MKTPALLLTLTLAVGIFALTSPAANRVVQMTSLYRFDPDYLEIEVGDTVTWYNADDTETHDATSDTSLWSTGDVFAEESSAPLQFNRPGTYPYRDTVYFNIGMVGTIKVNAATNASPAQLINPAALPGDNFRFTITNLIVGKTNVIETSTNLPNWSPVFTNVPTTDTLHFTNAAATTQRFFRSYQIP